MSRQIRILALLLAVLLLAAPLSGCRTAPAPETTTQETLAPETSPQETAPAPVDENRCGTSWIKIFGNRSLPADGWLEPDQVGFYFKSEDEAPSVTVMTVSELLQRVEDMGNLPRSHYLQDMLDERYDLLFACYDMALALGCRQFCFPTADLRQRDLTEVDEYLYNTFMMYGANRIYSSTKELTDADGKPFRFLTVQISLRNEDDMDKHTQAVDLARQIVDGMPDGLDELGKAKYLYEYMCHNVRYNYEYYDHGDDWNLLYDALIKHSTVCVGYAEALVTLYNLAGIDCIYVFGTTPFEGDIDGGHAWNYAKVNGQWYIFDTTWDETSSQRPFKPYYFGISTALADYYSPRIGESFWDGKLPACENILDPEYTILPQGY